MLLLLAGGLLIYLEFNVPGTIVPGALGTLMVLLAIFGLNLLPVQHTAILLLFAALALMVLEAKFASHGVLGIAGIICLVFGLATLVNGPTPEMRVHFGVAAGAGIGSASSPSASPGSPSKPARPNASPAPTPSSATPPSPSPRYQHLASQSPASQLPTTPPAKPTSAR